jgi:NAD+ synthase
VIPPLSPRLPAHAEPTIARFLVAEAAGGAGFVVGLSGGVDSSLVARLARDAVGAGGVHGVALPDGGPSDALVGESEAYARSLGITFESVPIRPVLEAFHRALPRIVDPVDLGNLAARARMTVLYAIARSGGRRVLGTGNKSELLLGYFTKYGDGGADLLPIGDLYKTEVYELARRLDLPESIQRRPPSAGFWPGQTDEAELGRPYAELDRILRGLEELRSESEIARLTGQPTSVVAEVARRVRTYRHKRRLPPIPKIGLRTVGLDWRD